MNKVTVSALQAPLARGNPEANRQQFAEQISGAEPADVYVLPEMFASGFALAGNAIAEPQPGPSLAWMQQQAEAHNAAITGSLAIQQGEHCYNRMYWVTPDGKVQHYDKRHLFRMAGEHQRYAPGCARKIVHWRGLRFLLQVCYDLRFPAFSRNFQQHSQGDYDVIIYVASWPAPRRKAWTALLPARAIENQAYVIGVNRSGEDHRGNLFSGDSAIYDYLGNTLSTAEDRVSCAIHAELSLEKLNNFRNKFPVGLDADQFDFK